MRLQTTFLALFYASTSEASWLRFRFLSETKIAGYEPLTDVSDHARIDLDQEKIAAYIDEGVQAGFDNAYAVYTKGAYSKPVATLSLPGGLGTSLAKNDKVVGQTATGAEVVLMTLAAVDAEATSIQLQYQNENCNVGGLPPSDQVTDGCLNATGTITPDLGTPIDYKYNVTKDNGNARTLQYFSTTANERMRPSEDTSQPFYESFQKFVNYYGDIEYADKWVSAAFDRTTTNFASGRGDADFSGFEYSARGQAIMKGTVYMNTWMYVIRELEDSLVDCQEGCTTDGCNDAPVNALDEAVAFYTGSLEGTAGTDGEGYLLYSLANKRCANFKTCGANGNEVTGNSKLNIDVFQQFESMKSNLAGGKCEEARKNKHRIVQLMGIPLVQATLRYAYIRSEDGADADDHVEGAAFAAATLPIIHACSEGDASTVYQNMNANQDTVDFAAVKSAMERNYGCMGMTCADVGGVYDEGTGTYKQGAEPCGGVGSTDTDSSSVNVGLAVGLSVGAVVAILLVYLWCKCCRKSGGVESKSGGDDNAMA